MKFNTNVDKIEEIICSNGSVAFKLSQSGERTNILVFSSDTDFRQSISWKRRHYANVVDSMVQDLAANECGMHRLGSHQYKDGTDKEPYLASELQVLGNAHRCCLSWIC